MVSVVALSLFPFFGNGYVYASKPSLKEVKGRQAMELKLPVKYEKYARKDVKIKLYVVNTRTGEEIISTHNRKLDKDGRVDLKVKNLDPGTEYKFKVKIKKESGGEYSDKSDSRKGSTRLLSAK